MITSIKSATAATLLACILSANPAQASTSAGGAVFPFSSFFGSTAWEVYLYTHSDSYFDVLFYQGLGIWSPFCFYDPPGGWTALDEQCFIGGSDQDFTPLYHAEFYDSRFVYNGEQFCAYATHVMHYWGANGWYEYRTPSQVCGANPWFLR